MDKAITTAMLIIISMIMSMMLFNAAYPAVMESSDAITTMANRTNERMKSQVEIIHAAGELDNTGWWQDTNGNGQFEVFVWVKNVGELRINAIEQTDVFFGPEGNFARIPYSANGSNGYPYWSWSLESGTNWDPNGTLRIVIRYGSPLSQGRYYIKVNTPSGASANYYTGM